MRDYSPQYIPFGFTITVRFVDVEYTADVGATQRTAQHDDVCVGYAHHHEPSAHEPNGDQPHCHDSITEP